MISDLRIVRTVHALRHWATYLGAGLMVGGLLLSQGCGDDADGGSRDDADGGSGDGDGSGDGGSGDGDDSGGGGGGQATFSCGKPGASCTEYRGSASSISAIRDATRCAEQGAIEGTGCDKDGAVICALATNGSTGSSGAQYYYGRSDDDLSSLKAACEAGGGTFSTP